MLTQKNIANVTLILLTKKVVYVQERGKILAFPCSEMA